MAPTAFAVVHPGLEAVLAEELAELGVPARVSEGGVTFEGTPDALATVHVWSRVAGRVLVRLGRVKAGSLEELATGLRGLPWRTYAVPRQPIEVDVTSHRSRLRRGGAVEKKVALAIGDALRGPRLSGGRPPREPLGVRLLVEDDRAQVSVDASGDRLHRRGWREATAKAPLRENLAAAVLRLAGWKPGTPLVDPFCGAGTFAVEAARAAAGLPPRIGWTYAFERWPGFDRGALARAEARRPARVPTVILGSDAAEGAVRAAVANARRARVEVPFARVRFEELEPPAGSPGVLVANLPYGRRVEVGDDAWRRWGGVLRDRWRGWTVTVIAPDPRLIGLLHPRAETVATFENGGIRVRVARFVVR